MARFAYNGKRQILTMVPVEKIIGKMTQVKNTCSAGDEVRHRWMGGSWRTTTERNLLVVRTNVRTKPLSGDEINARQRFTAVSALVKVTMANTALRPQIQTQYRSEKSTKGVFPSAYRTIRGFVFAVRAVEYDISIETEEPVDVTHFPALDA